MDGYVGSESFTKEQTMGNPAIESFQTPDLSLTAVSEKWITHKNALITWMNKPILKGLAARMIFLIIAFACFTGYSQQLGNMLMRPIYEYDQQYLEKTLGNLTGSLLLISAPKGALEMFQTAELEPTALGSKLGTIKIGKALEPYMHIIDDIWDFLVLSSYLVIAQIAILKFSSIISIKFFLGIGAFFCAIQYNRKTFFGKIGLTLIFLFVMIYFFYPLILGMGAKTYEQHQVETSIQLSENLGILKEQILDIDPSLKHIKDTITDTIPQIIGQGLRTAMDATWGLVIGLILMFVIIPLMILGTIYLIARRAMLYLDMPETAEKIDSVSNHILNKVGSHSRTSRAISGGQ